MNRIHDEARELGLKVAVCSAATKSSAIVVLENLMGAERFKARPPDAPLGVEESARARARLRTPLPLRGGHDCCSTADQSSTVMVLEYLMGAARCPLRMQHHVQSWATSLSTLPRRLPS